MSTSLETRNARPTILLVEDDGMLRELFSRILSDESFRVLEAENGEIALKLLGGLGRPPEVVLTDVAMPVMDGFMFARIFRSLHPAVPIMFMTGALLQAQGTPLPDTGARVLLKPFDAEVLLEAVQSCLDQGRSVRAITSDPPRGPLQCAPLSIAGVEDDDGGEVGI